MSLPVLVGRFYQSPKVGQKVSNFGAFLEIFALVKRRSRAAAARRSGDRGRAVPRIRTCALGGPSTSRCIAQFGAVSDPAVRTTDGLRISARARGPSTSRCAPRRQDRLSSPPGRRWPLSLLQFRVFRVFRGSSQFGAVSHPAVRTIEGLRIVLRPWLTFLVHDGAWFLHRVSRVPHPRFSAGGPGWPARPQRAK